MVGRRGAMRGAEALMVAPVAGVKLRKEVT